MTTNSCHAIRLRVVVSCKHCLHLSLQELHHENVVSLFDCQVNKVFHVYCNVLRRSPSIYKKIKEMNKIFAMYL